MLENWGLCQGLELKRNGLHHLMVVQPGEDAPMAVQAMGVLTPWVRLKGVVL